jgi:hypothetical protein
MCIAKQIHDEIISSELLLDEEGTQVRELPCARDAQDDELDEDPADNAAVGGLRLVPELGLTFLQKWLIAALSSYLIKRLRVVFGRHSQGMR